MNELEDIKLRALLNEIKLESPTSNFSVGVMNKIFEEDSLLEKVKSERILGKSFWLILILFVILFAVIYYVSTSGMTIDNQFSNILSGLNSNRVSMGYQSFFERIGTVPISIVGILLASSTLLFIDRIVIANSKVFQKSVQI
ncbi:MAG: hypothetical protein KAH68_02920 [Draconibacterium sp.]|nr:hypothetical protein [Draconibacterium sp.]